MFSRRDDASKVALVHLCERLSSWGFGLIDCQMRTDHLISLGATEIPREGFVTLIDRFCPLPGATGSWDDGEIRFPGAPEPEIPGQREELAP
jgi:leucyl/phenylalanyl-tRNA--protein transferase